MELKKALCTAHEKFCFWPDSPCPGWCLSVASAHVQHYSLFSPFLLLLLSPIVGIVVSLQVLKASGVIAVPFFPHVDDDTHSGKVTSLRSLSK